MSLPNFYAYPIVSFKQLTDADTISQFREKVQFNFDQVYLNFVNKVLKGEKGDQGYTGLSIKGDKGDKGDKGSLIWFDNVIDNQPVTNPLYNEGDVIVSDNGSYFIVTDDGLGNLIFSLQFVLPSNSLFITQLDFSLLGGITAHQLYSSSTDSTVLLASRIGTEARYRRMVIGDNVYSSSTIDSLTLINILDNTTSTTSTPTKQLSLRYRDVNNGAVSPTSFDFKYYINSNIEYKTMGDNVTNISLIRDNTSGESKHTINTNKLYFTSGISNFETASSLNSVILSKEVSTWRFRQPDGESLTFGFYDRLILSGDRVGYNTASPTRDIDFHGQFIVGEDDTSVFGAYLAYIKSDPAFLELGYKNSSLRISTNQMLAQWTVSEYTRFSAASFDVKTSNGGRLLNSAGGTQVRHNNSGLIMDSTGAYMVAGGNTNNQVLLNTLSSNLLSQWGSLLINNQRARITYGGTSFDFKSNGFHVETIRGITDDIELIPTGTLGTVSLKSKAKVSSQNFTADVDSTSPSGTVYVVDYDGAVSTTPTDLFTDSYDRIIYVSVLSGTGNASVFSGVHKLGTVGINGCGMFLIPAGTACRIVYIGSVTAKLTFGGLGV